MQKIDLAHKVLIQGLFSFLWYWNIVWLVGYLDVLLRKCPHLQLWGVLLNLVFSTFFKWYNVVVKCGWSFKKMHSSSDMIGIVNIKPLSNWLLAGGYSGRAIWSCTWTACSGWRSMSAYRRSTKRSPRCRSLRRHPTRNLMVVTTASATAVCRGNLIRDVTVLSGVWLRRCPTTSRYRWLCRRWSQLPLAIRLAVLYHLTPVVMGVSMT